MAFTLAHPAAVLPLAKLRMFALLPLIVGSITPDLIGFLPYQLERRLPHSHSPIGTVLIDLPLGYVLLLLLMWLRSALLQPLWEPHRTLVAAGLNEFFSRPNRWWLALPSLLVGSWTHIVWDRFTHESNWTYRNLPLLYQPLFPDSPHQLALYHALQYTTSVIGLAIIGWYYWLQLRSVVATVHRSVAAMRLRVQWLVGITIAALSLGLLRLLLSRALSVDSLYERLSLVLKTGLISFALLYLLFALLLSRVVARHAAEHSV